ncbi:QacE family quaternary ammonium compound efflux SMR transporter [Neobacillus sp. MM2021_6]|uniref:DMT family transporter n=1 Tax=Bacillaceae TaxID=186817 RepID=UPI00140CD58E|nr:MULTISPECIES: SMR family transporter [Bacillaceae]MBO0959738.1 QacE family quaternary ammonium compound efflux SMR transporter [Neobacillus sp. MM2021_6]NHC19182.1 QacE family quaternary ammonium compound efflux SMR transporter [Bacillus sp. MM2020_4]WML38294.1 SMR family transporter [Neobacillus sp. OS1-2]
MGWLFVLLAAVGEITGAAGLKLYSQRKTFRNGLLYIGGFGASFAFLYTSFHFLQLSVAYIVWVGIGTAGAVLINIFLFGESKNIGRIVSVGLIIIGVMGLRAFS